MKNLDLLEITGLSGQMETRFEKLGFVGSQGSQRGSQSQILGGGLSCQKKKEDATNFGDGDGNRSTDLVIHSQMT